MGSLPHNYSRSREGSCWFDSEAAGGQQLFAELYSELGTIRFTIRHRGVGGCVQEELPQVVCGSVVFGSVMTLGVG